jgi:hypothetical protein
MPDHPSVRAIQSMREHLWLFRLGEPLGYFEARVKGGRRERPAALRLGSGSRRFRRARRKRLPCQALLHSAVPLDKRLWREIRKFVLCRDRAFVRGDPLADHLFTQSGGLRRQLDRERKCDEEGENRNSQSHCRGANKRDPVRFATAVCRTQTSRMRRHRLRHHRVSDGQPASHLGNGPISQSVVS